MQARVSILALDKWTDGAIWDDFQVPEGVDRQAAIDNILLECAELGLLYADPDVLKRRIQVWTTKQLPGWERIYRALTEEYNPLHNYDRHEEWTEAGEASAQGTNTNSVAGFNQSAGLADRDRSDQDTSSKSSTSRQGHLYGNIGVTTSATMLAEELQVRAAHNMLDVILESFKQEFVILIY